jgi:hypothetical protein
MIEPLKYDSCSQSPLASFLGRAEVDSAIIQLPENNPFLNMREGSDEPPSFLTLGASRSVLSSFKVIARCGS